MSTFYNSTITNAGRLVMAKGQIGLPIHFTRIVIGDATLPDSTDIASLSNVIHPVLSLNITKCKLNRDGTVTIGTSFNNTDIDTGFFYRELGLFAEDPDVGEVLYCYGNAGDEAEWIPPQGATIVEKLVDIVTISGAAANVSANIESGIYATKDEVFRSYLQAEMPTDWKKGDCWYQIVSTGGSLPPFDGGEYGIFNL